MIIDTIWVPYLYSGFKRWETDDSLLLIEVSCSLQGRAKFYTDYTYFFHFFHIAEQADDVGFSSISIFVATLLLIFEM